MSSPKWERESEFSTNKNEKKINKLLFNLLFGGLLMAETAHLFYVSSVWTRIEHSWPHRTCTSIDTSKQSTNRIWFPIATRLANLVDFPCVFSAHKSAAIPTVACAQPYAHTDDECNVTCDVVLYLVEFDGTWTSNTETADVYLFRENKLLNFICCRFSNLNQLVSIWLRENMKNNQ